MYEWDKRGMHLRAGSRTAPRVRGVVRQQLMMTNSSFPLANSKAKAWTWVPPRVFRLALVVLALPVALVIPTTRMRRSPSSVHVDKTRVEALGAIASNQSSVAALSKTVQIHAQGVDKQVELHMRRSGMRLDDHANRLHVPYSHLKELMEHMCIAKAEELPKEAAPSGSDRPTDPAKVLVSIDEVRHVVTPWIQDASSDVDDYEISAAGTEPTSKQRVQDCAAACAARQALGAKACATRARWALSATVTARGVNSRRAHRWATRDRSSYLVLTEINFTFTDN
ncbi:unnamed protein product [Prorocentrum cordatum]|uniref:Uncharacterized protein n=1 Tax=Prorocentrum cordatum TaxID=2364126 RepID=A0ABN9QW80_9DINO|nr:unnamed protein product [Polarella glacialis]